MPTQNPPHQLHPQRPGIARKVVIGAVAVGVIGVAALALSLGGQEQSDEPRVDIYRVASTSFDVTTTANGELAARNETKLTSELDSTSTITEIVPEGSTVSKGDVLVRLSTDELERNLDNEMLSLESARSDLVSAENALKIQISDNESALRQAELKLELARLELRKWQQGDVKQKREELTTAIDKADRELSRLKDKYERSQDLFAREFISKDELERDELAYVEAESNLKLAKLRYEVFEEFEYEKEFKRLQSDVDEAVAELDRVKTRNASQLANKQADLNNRRAQLAIREDKVAKLQAQLEASVIRAPTDGLVVYATSTQPSWRNNDGPLQVGRQIRPKEELITLPDTSQMVAKVKVHESVVGRISPGQNARVTIDAAQGRTFEGSVVDIGVMAESGGWRDPNLREYEVRIALDIPNEDHGLKPSMRCEAQIIISEVQDTLAVPTPAVFNEEGVAYVYTPDGSRYRRVPVATGRRSDTLVEILAGVDARTPVLLREPSPGRVVDEEFDEDVLAELRQVAPPPGMRGRYGRMMGAGGRAAADKSGGQDAASEDTATAENPGEDSIDFDAIAELEGEELQAALDKMVEQELAKLPTPGDDASGEEETDAEADAPAEAADADSETAPKTRQSSQSTQPEPASE